MSRRVAAASKSPRRVQQRKAPRPEGNNPKPDDDATKGNVSVSDDIKKACGLSDDEAYFAFNSAAVTAKNKTVLKKIADCFETGPLKGSKMDLVGHADPRGTDDYNMALGGRRADNVKSVMVSLGLSSGNVVTSSWEDGTLPEPTSRPGPKLKGGRHNSQVGRCGARTWWAPGLDAGGGANLIVSICPKRFRSETT